ncbi:Fc.00g055700.m01.CDS01 [Cosmosporella sp. VM-42]
MANNSVVLPCAILGSIVAVMLMFIWWFFPRIWNKGTKQEFDEIVLSFGAGNGDGHTQSERMQIAGQRAREYVQAIDARNKARAEGRALDEPPPTYQPFRRAYRNEPPTAVG